jgi:hypothetical protein
MYAITVNDGNKRRSNRDSELHHERQQHGRLQAGKGKLASKKQHRLKLLVHFGSDLCRIEQDNGSC